MDHQEAVVAHLHRLDRRITRIGGGVLGLLAVGLLAAMAFQDPETVAVQNIVRTHRLELTNSDGKVVAVVQAVDATEDAQIDRLEDQELPVVTYHKNGRKAWQSKVINWKREGPWLEWASNGALVLVGEFKNDQKVGVWRRFNSDDGHLIEEGSYEAGLREGLWRTWLNWTPIDDTGATVEPPPLESNGAFLQGKRHGIWTFLHWTEQKSSEGEFDEGKKVGDWKAWNEDGSINEQLTGFYENGVKIR